ncbi:unnamed protein product [Knipowitschia caucasica]|uniref:Uncharacterized protein n=1 Tax=Knipowitschia caucasica TaxID=637954 RepID=A0AAV2MBI7_KNICA
MEIKTNPGCAANLKTLTEELITNATALLEEIQEMVDHCSFIRTLRSHKKEQSVCAATIREDGETLVIDGFRFEDAASREDLGRQNTTRENNS